MKKVAIVALLVACSTSPNNEPSKLQITESTTGVDIVGLSASGTITTEARLELGRFTIPDDGRLADGRRLTLITTTGVSREHVSEGTGVLILPFPPDQTGELTSFLMEPDVSFALLRWGITFDETTASIPVPVSSPFGGSTAETPYSGGCGPGWVCQIQWSRSSAPYAQCNGCSYPLSQCGGTYSCHQYAGPGGQQYQLTACVPTQQISQRACTVPNGATNCGTAGPNGCAVCWSMAGGCGAAAYCSGGYSGTQVGNCVYAN